MMATDPFESLLNVLTFGGKGGVRQYFGTGADGAFDSNNEVGVNKTYNLLPKSVAYCQDISYFSHRHVSGEQVSLILLVGRHSNYAPRKGTANFAVRWGQDFTGSPTKAHEIYIRDKVKVVAGKQYTFSFYFCSTSSTYDTDYRITIKPRIKWYNASNVLLSTSDGTGVNYRSLASEIPWTKGSCVATAPANATQAELCIYIEGKAIYSVRFFFDEMLFALGNVSNWTDETCSYVKTPSEITKEVHIPVNIDSGPIVKNYTTFRIRPGHVVTTSNRCKGLIIYATDSIIIDGELSMSERGLGADPYTTPPLIFPISLDEGRLMWPGEAVDGSSKTKFVGALLGGRGGRGGDGGKYNRTDAGCAGRGGLGSFGTWYSGGGGGAGGGAAYSNTNGGHGSDASYSLPSGSGGNSGSGTAGGNAINGFGPGGGGTDPEGIGFDGWGIPGGFVALIAPTIVINSGGVISAKGGPGSDGGASVGSFPAGGGGGGGCGGGIVLLIGSSITNNGTVDVSGGPGGKGGATYGGDRGKNGEDGQPGTFKTVILS